MIFLAGKISLTAATETNLWLLTSPDGQCTISVSLDDGNLCYEALRTGKVVIQKSPLGLRRDDQDFEGSLVFDHGGGKSKVVPKNMNCSPEPGRRWITF